jgi:hypothetical protein
MLLRPLNLTGKSGWMDASHSQTYLRPQNMRVKRAKGPRKVLVNGAPNHFCVRSAGLLGEDSRWRPAEEAARLPPLAANSAVTPP